MAYDKIIPIRSRLDHCVGYVLNPEKTGLETAMDYIGREDKNRTWCRCSSDSRSQNGRGGRRRGR